MFDLKINVGHCDLYFMVQWFCFISWRLFDVWISYFGIMSQFDLTFDLKINVGGYDIHFMVPRFCLISWRLFDVWTSYFGIMSQYDLTFDLQINVGHCDLYFGPVILPYILKTVRCMNIILWNYESVWHSLPQNKCTSLWPVFHGPVILPYILKTVWCMNIILRDNEAVKLTSDLKINVGHCDIYFIVQWFAVYLEVCLMYENHTLGLLVSMTHHFT